MRQTHHPLKCANIKDLFTIYYQLMSVECPCGITITKQHSNEHQLKCNTFMSKLNQIKEEAIIKMKCDGLFILFVSTHFGTYTFL